MDCQVESKKKDEEMISIISNSIKNFEIKNLKELRKLLRLDNLQIVEEITTLEYLKYVINSQSMRSAVVKLESEYRMMYKTLGDGNCFYRCIMLSYIFWLLQQNTSQQLQDFIKRIHSLQSVTSIFQTLSIDCNQLKSVFLLFLLKLLEDKNKGTVFKMLDIIKLYNSLPEVDFSQVIICRQLIINTYEEYKEHESIRDFLDDEMKEKIHFVLPRYFYEAQYVIIPLAAQTFQCELNIQNFYQPDEYSNKVNIEKINYQPLEVLDKNAELKIINVLYNGGHYEILVSEIQAQKDFYSLNNKKVINFNKFTQQQQQYLINHFIQRYQTEIIRQNSMEEAIYVSQESGNQDMNYESVDWQRLQNSNEYQKLLRENKELKMLIETILSESPQENDVKETNENKPNLLPNSQQTKQLNQFEKQQGKPDQNSYQNNGTEQNHGVYNGSSKIDSSEGRINDQNRNNTFQVNIEIEDNFNETKENQQFNGISKEKNNLSNSKQFLQNSFTKENQNSNNANFIENQQNFYNNPNFQKPQISENIIQNESLSEDHKPQANNEMNSQQNKNNQKKYLTTCISCDNSLPQKQKCPYLIYLANEDDNIDFMYKLCFNCFKSHAQSYEIDQDFIEINGQLYHLTKIIITQFKQFQYQIQEISEERKYQLSEQYKKQEQYKQQEQTQQYNQYQQQNEQELGERCFSCNQRMRMSDERFKLQDVNNRKICYSICQECVEISIVSYSKTKQTVRINGKEYAINFELKIFIDKYLFAVKNPDNFSLMKNQYS